MRNKYKILIIVLISIIASFLTYFFMTDKREKEKVLTIDFSFEKIIPNNTSILIRFEDFTSVWEDFKNTNFYPQLKTFLGWFWNEMPSETLVLSKDIKDIQEKIGFNLDEKNIFAILGKKIFLASWLENKDDKKILILANIDIKSTLYENMKILIERKIGVEEYKNITIDIFSENKYWTLFDDKLIISNDIGTIRKAIDLSLNLTDNCIFNSPEFKNHISKTISKNYIYIKTDKFDEPNYGFLKEQLDAILLSINIKNGILIKSFVFPKILLSKKSTRRITSLRFAPKDAMVYIAGDFAIPYLTSKSKIEKFVIGKESGYILIPNDSNNAIMIFCEVTNKKIFLKGFEKIINPTEKGIFNYTLPLFGSIQFKYFFLKNYFIICSPPEYSENIKNLIAKKEDLLINSSNYKRLEIPQKNNGIFYINISDLFFRLFKKNYLNFIEPSGGYTTYTPTCSESTYYMPMTDLSDSQWTDMLSELKKIASKKIDIERDRITYKNLLYLRESLNIYNAKTNRYPKKIDSLIEEYINEIPQELVKKSNEVSGKFNGSGGWFYKNGEIKLNVFGIDSSGTYYSRW